MNLHVYACVYPLRYDENLHMLGEALVVTDQMGVGRLSCVASKQCITNWCRHESRHLIVLTIYWCTQV